jgi:hypothetical protein
VAKHQGRSKGVCECALSYRRGDAGAARVARRGLRKVVFLVREAPRQAPRQARRRRPWDHARLLVVVRRPVALVTQRRRPEEHFAARVPNDLSGAESTLLGYFKTGRGGKEEQPAARDNEAKIAEKVARKQSVGEETARGREGDQGSKSFRTAPESTLSRRDASAMGAAAMALKDWVWAPS